jgi:acyl carrier protein
VEQRTIEDTVVRIIADHLGLPPATLNPHAHIFDDLGADSFDYIELIITIEERFGINICVDERNSLQRISDIVAFLEKILPQHGREMRTAKEGQIPLNN